MSATRARPWSHLLSLGSNVDSERWVPFALERIAARFQVAATSSRYDVPAVGGGAGTPDFVNMALLIRSDLPPRALRVACRHLEERCGRRRGADRFAPRTLDLDVVHSRADAGGAAAFHPDLLTEAYVLVPCAEIAPDVALVLPDGASTTLAELESAAFPGWRAQHRRA